MFRVKNYQANKIDGLAYSRFPVQSDAFKHQFELDELKILSKS